MDEQREVLLDLSTELHEAIKVARRAGYLARRLGVSAVDQQIEDDLLPLLVAFADEDRSAPHPGSVGQLLALLDEDV